MVVPADEELRVGVIGAGFIARYHAMQLSLSPEPNRIVAVADPDGGSAEAFAHEVGATVVSGADELAAASDVVFVCSWTAAHAEGVAAAAAHGRPVFCEKPLGVDPDDARRVAELVAGTGGPNAVGLVLRTSPAVLALRELVHDPSSGPVMSVVFRDDQYLPTQGIYDSTWRADRRLAGSGVLLEHSIHDVDLLEWLLGPLSTVSASSGSLHGIDGVEDAMAVLARIEGGPSVVLSTVWHDVTTRPSQRRIEVLCRDAVVTLEGDFVGPVRRQTAAGEQVLEGDGLVDWLAARGVVPCSTETALLGAVRRWRAGEEPDPVRPDVTDALRAHRVVAAVYDSAALGGAPVAIDAPQGSSGA